MTNTAILITLLVFVQYTFTKEMYNNSVDENKTKNKIENLKESILKLYSEPKHALFYQTDSMPLKHEKKFLNIDNLSNLTLPTTGTTLLEESTMLSTTLLYDTSQDDNMTNVTDLTTPSSENTTVFENVTEFSLFPIFNLTNRSTPARKKFKPKDDGYCHCNLLLNACDPNCCCDQECSSEERDLFSHCLEDAKPIPDGRYCYSDVFYYKNNTKTQLELGANGLFCIAKDNLPKKRDVNSYSKITKKSEAEKVIRDKFRWPDYHKPKILTNFTYANYTYGDPIWMMTNSSISSPQLIEIPTRSVNNNCNIRSPIKYLQNEETKCIVRLSQLEMLNIYENYKNVFVISPLKNISHENATKSNFKTNCSTVLCTEWNILVCDEDKCDAYNETLHTPSCIDNMCTRIATTIEYNFHCYNSSIYRADVYLHIRNVFPNLYLQQDVRVKFYLDRENSTKHVIQLSGNPGYTNGKDVISSFAKGNFSEHFFNSTTHLANTLAYFKNIGGSCVFTNITYTTVKFGYNLKNKCFYQYKSILDKNATKTCNVIQNDILKNIGVGDNKTIFISEFGNPFGLNDKSWIQMNIIQPETRIKGLYTENGTHLQCNNLVTKVSYEFIYANVHVDSENVRTEKKILGSIAYLRGEDFKLEIDDMSMIITVETSFHDITRHPHYEYAKGPHINIHLPKDFFYPFSSSEKNIAFKKMWLFVLVLLNFLLVG